MENAHFDLKLFNKIKTAILSIWTMFWPEYLNDEERLSKLDKFSELNDIIRVLNSYVCIALRESKLENVEKLRELYPLENFNELLRDSEIRLDFERALRSVMYGWHLGRPLGWGLSKEDLLTLEKLYQDKEDLREKITDLLEDCNFHTVNHMLNTQRYEEFEQYVSEFYDE